MAPSGLTVLALLGGQALAMHQEHASNHIGVASKVAVSDPKYKQECWQKRAMLSLVQNPGAGIDKFTAYQTVEKDGFMEADCIKDYMYEFGDKFGDNRHSYKLATTSNVSIVHYTDHVEKLDRKPMTQKVCFEFCRTVPMMGFFGVVNGRDCYCTPYYKPMESDSSNCDAVCDGDNTMMCGGKSKSTVFSMHMCANTATELSDAASKATMVKTAMDAEVTTVKGLSTDMQASATKLQASFGKVGDSASTGLFQSAKVYAGDMLHKAEDAEKISTKLGAHVVESKTITKFTDPKEVEKADALLEDIAKTLESGEKVVEDLDEMKSAASPPKNAANASKQYYPVMYFVDKEQKDTPQTCGGDAVGKPIVGGDEDGCAAACDSHGKDCVGYSFYSTEKKLCFLFGKFKTAFYFTGCGAKKFLLLQTAQSAAPYTVKCQAKFSTFDGTTLKPDASGKCKQCMKKVTKADRCFA